MRTAVLPGENRQTRASSSSPLSTARMPWDRLSHTTGMTIRAAMTPGTAARPVHSSTSRMKEATGAARTTRTAGESSRSAQGEAQVRTASSPPRHSPPARPRVIRPREASTAAQNSSVPARPARARRTEAG